MSIQKTITSDWKPQGGTVVQAGNHLLERYALAEDTQGLSGAWYYVSNEEELLAALDKEFGTPDYEQLVQGGFTEAGWYALLLSETGELSARHENVIAALQKAYTKILSSQKSQH